ncbi:MAG: urease accessory protein UreG [Acidimicrobiales bacterium]
MERTASLPREPSSGLPLRLGIGGPVGSGKTALVAEVCRALSDQVSLGVVTNDIYTTEDADFLRRAGVLDGSRIIAVETGCCPHTAIRDDIAANLSAIDELLAATPDLELVVIESGGDNLTATFSSGLVDRQIFVLDVAGGDKVPRKGGPGVIRSDLLVINKVDLAPMVGADLRVMEDDAVRVRSGAPVALVSLRTGDGFGGVLRWLSEWVESARPVRGNPSATGARTGPPGRRVASSPEA